MYPLMKGLREVQKQTQQGESEKRWKGFWEVDHWRQQSNLAPEKQRRQPLEEGKKNRFLKNKASSFAKLRPLQRVINLSKSTVVTLFKIF